MNLDAKEINRFSELSEDWWNPEGSMKALHATNSLRLDFISQFTILRDKQILDIGCGAGILSESMALSGANVIGIDLSEELLSVARSHANESLSLDYCCISSEEHAQKNEKTYDIITCMEMLEHVPNPKSVVESCAKMLKEQGTVFFSTINRNAKSFAKAILGAEYFLKILPQGIHDYEKFITPAELARFARDSDLRVVSISGFNYDILKNTCKLTDDTSVNYFMVCTREY